MKRSVWIGWDPREAAAFAVARGSLQRRLARPVPVHGLMLEQLIEDGLYRRPMSHRGKVMWDDLSDAPMSTEHANARFLVPHLAGGGWAVFMDGDVLVRFDLSRLFDVLDPAMALYCVKHDFTPPEGAKMDGQIQTAYARKNWSSFMVFNCDHPANAGLTLDLVNSAPGRDLHRFCWLKDEEIGELSPAFNHLVGHTRSGLEPVVVHFTDGVPDMPGYERCPYADEWRAERRLWAA